MAGRPGMQGPWNHQQHQHQQRQLPPQAQQQGNASVQQPQQQHTVPNTAWPSAASGWQTTIPPPRQPQAPPAQNGAYNNIVPAVLGGGQAPYPQGNVMPGSVPSNGAPSVFAQPTPSVFAGQPPSDRHQPLPASNNFPNFAPNPFAGGSQNWPNHVPPSVLTPSFEQQQFQFGGSGAPAGSFQPQHPNQGLTPSHSGGFTGKNEDEDDFKGSTTGGQGSGGGGQQKPGTSDFVKKLFTMLDDLSYAHIVSWSQAGDSFVVRNMNDFTKHILPRHFRHSNFASFVRQLNKYDFHKVKNPEEQATQPADQIWEFKHPEFIRGREDLLENVRRKMPTGKKKGGDERDSSPTMYNPAEAAERGAEEYQQLKDQIATLTTSQEQMSSHISNLTKQYQGVIGEMLTFQRNMVQQDQLMQNLIQYLMNLENDRKVEGAPSSSSRQTPALSDGPFVSSQDASKLIGSYDEVARASFGQMSDISQRAASQSNDANDQEGNRATSSHGRSSSSRAGASPAQASVAASTHARSSTGRPSMGNGNLSPKSTASLASPATVGPDVPVAPSALPEKSRATPGHSDDTSMFLHPPHLDNNESSTLFNTAANALDNPSLAGFEGAGLRVFTVGTLQPREANGESSGPSPSQLSAAFARASGQSGSGAGGSPDFGISVPHLESLPSAMPRVDKRTTSTAPTPNPHGGKDDSAEASGSRSGTPSEGGSNMLRVRRSTYVPGWAVPPRVLLVDDDAVCRKLSSKFLQVFGCAIDVAVDGVNAVNKMNLEQYDLVLMDIVMPNLDGVSATSLIREFDPRTPIISMTSNSGPSELLNYMSSGMNDILPKPFTKEGLLSMLEKHLIHLKTVQKLDQIPKQLGLPPVSKEAMQDVLSATAASAAALDLPGGALTSPSGKAMPAAAMMGNGPQVTSVSGSDNTPSSVINANTEDGDGDSDVVNPLAGMGFSDEEYISMVQSLLAAGTVSGEMSDSVSGVMGVQRGEGASAASNYAQSRGPDEIAVARNAYGEGSGRKRGADASPPREVNESKKPKSRFEEVKA